jgi:ribonuclease HI
LKQANEYVPRKYEPTHWLADGRGRLFPHRKALSNKIGRDPHRCRWCGRRLTWKDESPACRTETDHLDGIKYNNHPGNLVPSCHECNFERGLLGNPQDYSPVPRGFIEEIDSIPVDTFISELDEELYGNPHVDAYGSSPVVDAIMLQLDWMKSVYMTPRQGWIPTIHVPEVMPPASLVSAKPVPTGIAPYEMSLGTERYAARDPPQSWPDHGERARREESVEVKVWTDGAAEPNPGTSGIGVVVRDTRGQIQKSLSKAIGHGTNNRAEYVALIVGLRLARIVGATSIQVYCDSTLVVNQVNGKWKVKNPDMRRFHGKALQEVEEFQARGVPVKVEWIPRDENEDADLLANASIGVAGNAWQMRKMAGHS